jgi:hypothetical protein
MLIQYKCANKGSRGKQAILYKIINSKQAMAFVSIADISIFPFF